MFDLSKLPEDVEVVHANKKSSQNLSLISPAERRERAEKRRQAKEEKERKRKESKLAKEAKRKL